MASDEAEAGTTRKGDSKTMKDSKRRFFSVTSSLQYRFLAMTLSYSFVLVCFFALAVFIPDVLEMRNEALGLEIRGTAASRLLVKNTWVWPAVLCLILFLSIHSFRAFQKIMGPLYRFRCAFEELENGKIRFPLKIRKKDYLRNEEESFNKMLKTLLGRFENIKDAAEGALRSLENVEQEISRGLDPEKTPGDLMGIHRDHLERLAGEIRFFQMENRSAQSRAQVTKRL